MEAFYRMRAISIFNVLVTIVGSMGLMGLGLAIVGLYGLVRGTVWRPRDNFRMITGAKVGAGYGDRNLGSPDCRMMLDRVPALSSE
jgi:hypothetical protein